MSTAVVVGSGPNGLAAAIVLAQAGLDVTVVEAAETIGGGTRSAELTVPGLVHDVCSAVHPMGVASPFFDSLDLGAHGLQWAWPEIDVAHPLDHGRAGVLVRDLDRTVRGLGADGDAWRRLFAPLVARADAIIPEVLGPVPHVPRHPFALARFGVPALLPASLLARCWKGEEARALFAGLAAHAVRPLDAPATGGIGLAFGVTAHAYGWPVAVGGSASIADALHSVLREAGGRVETGTRVTDLPDADVVMLDTAPDQAVTMLGDRLPSRTRRAFERWKHGPAVFKLDLAVEGGIPWQDESARRAGTVHVGGRFEEVHAAESAVSAGSMPARPFVLVAQQYLADPGRSVGDVHPVWTYAHVPNGFTGDATEAILAQLERFAPGTRGRVVASAVRTPADLYADNANYVGGDISGGALTLGQLVFRPQLAPDPYRLTPRRGSGPSVHLCSSSAPPGGGVHGMAGFHAATRALRGL
ncbi:phytoene desaturase family protein [Aeromicrobium sp. CF4.19]|uniref:phytoene desaturase family protein n=1 Tax=Aeromicrobium sp. CF4.19 TaxID=3373082 RepID=UPI003EE7EE00